MNTAQTAQNWAHQALPPGWEAKYDPGQRRYFYINHSTQTTSWEDPRPAYYRQQQQVNSMTHGRASPRSPHVPLAVPHAPQNQLSPTTQPTRMIGQRSPAIPRHSPQPQPRLSPHPQGHPSPLPQGRASPLIHGRQSPLPQARQSPQPPAAPAHYASAAETIAMKDLNKPDWQKEVEDKYNIRVNTLQAEDAEEAASNDGSRPESPHPPQATESPAPRTASKKKRRPKSKSRETSFIQGYEEKIQKLRTMFPTADETIIKQYLIKNNNNEGATIGDLQGAGFQRQDATSVVLMANRIKRDFPSAEAAMIRDILHGVSNDESKARHELKSLGYQQTAATSNTLSANRSTRGISPSRSGSSTRINTPSSATKKAPPRKEEVLPKEVNKTARSKLKQTMAKEFPDQSASTIEMACDVCHYDEGKVRTLIQSMATTQQAKNIVSRMGLSVDSEGRKSPSPAASSPAPGPSTSAATASVFTYPDIGSTLSAITGSSAMSSGIGHTSAVGSSIGLAPGLSSTRGHTSAVGSNVGLAPGLSSTRGHTSAVGSSVGLASGFSSTRGHTSAFSSLNTSTGPTIPTTRPARTRAVTTTQPSGSGYRPPPPANRDPGSYYSSMVSETQGANQQLAKGPDRSILIEEYLYNNGPDESLVSGADPVLTSGPSTPVSGPNSDLCSGADPAFHAGPDTNLVLGPACRTRGSGDTAAVGRSGVCNHFVTSLCGAMSGKWGSTSV